ncbi:MAG: hypothetical protein FK733_14385 [Asgard group archaeon]|nr:hypothetical protein [Asgard group archaeon]
MTESEMEKEMRQIEAEEEILDTQPDTSIEYQFVKFLKLYRKRSQSIRSLLFILTGMGIIAIGLLIYIITLVLP